MSTINHKIMWLKKCDNINVTTYNICIITSSKLATGSEGLAGYRLDTDEGDWLGGTGWEGQAGRDRLGGTGREGQAGRDRLGGTGWEGQAGRDRLGGTGREGQAGRDRLGKTGWERQAGKDRLGRTGWEGQAGRDRLGGAGWLQMGGTVCVVNRLECVMSTRAGACHHGDVQPAGWARG